MIWIWLCWCAFCAALLEVILGNHGVPMPLLAMVTFYFTATLGWKAVFIPLVVAGTILDLLLARTFPTALLLLPAIMAMAHWWKSHGDCKSVPTQALPGVALGVVIGLGRVMLESWTTEKWGLGLLGKSAWLVFLFALAGAVVTPLLFRLLDRAAVALSFTPYRTIQDTVADPSAG